MRYYLSFLFFLMIVSCKNTSGVTLSDTKDEKIVFEGSEHYGNWVTIHKKDTLGDVKYVISLNGRGVIMCVRKIFGLSKEERYLVSEARDTLLGAKLFDYTILGYYDAPTRNYIISNNNKGKEFPCLPAEIDLFKEVESLMKGRNLPFVQLESLEKVFWFSYEIDSV